MSEEGNDWSLSSLGLSLGRNKSTSTTSATTASSAANLSEGSFAEGTRTNANSLVTGAAMGKKPVVTVACEDTVVGNGCRIKGSIETKGNARIEGIVEGEIHSEGELTIGEDSQIRANIEAESLKIFGNVTGDICCSEKVEAFSGANIVGNIYSPRVALHDGVSFDGNCRMEKPASGARSAN